MRRVVEQKLVTACMGTMLTQAAQQGRVIPFVCNYDIGVSQSSIEIDAQRVVETTAQLRIGCVKFLDHSFATLLAQVVKAPAVRRLEDPGRVPLAQQFARNTPQNVGGGMIPVGNEGVVEQDEAHVAFPLTAGDSSLPSQQFAHILRSKNRVCIKYGTVHAHALHGGPFPRLKLHSANRAAAKRPNHEILER